MLCVVVCITLVVMRDGRNSLWWTESVYVYRGHCHALHLHLLNVNETLDILIFVNVIITKPDTSCAFSRLLPWQLVNVLKSLHEHQKC